MPTTSGKIGHKELAKLRQRRDIVWDGQLKGFGARRSENFITFMLMYRTREGRQRWYTIADTAHRGLQIPHATRPSGFFMKWRRAAIRQR